MKRISPLLVVLASALGACFGQLPKQWTKLTMPAAYTAHGNGYETMYVTRDGVYAFFTSKSGVFRVKTTDVEAAPANPAAWTSWTAMNMTGWPTDAASGGYQPIATWTENPVTHDVVVYAGYTNGTSAGTCGTGTTACRVVVINRSTLAWRASTTPMRGMLTGISVDPSNGYMYASALGPIYIYRSTDGGNTWAVLVSNPYPTLTGQPGGYLYGLKMFGNSFHWGGEGANVTSAADFSSSSIDFTTKANGYSRNSGWFASDVYERQTPHYIVACCRDVNGYNIQKWDATSGKWTQLGAANGFIQWSGEVTAAGQGIVHGNQPDEFYLAETGSMLSTIYYTKGSGATHWGQMDYTGLPTFSTSVKVRFPVMNHGSCSLYVWINSVYYVHPCM